MTPLQFIRSDTATNLLERASRAAAMPISVHFVSDDIEGPNLFAQEGCAACRYVNGTEAGAARCRRDRVEASTKALRRDRNVPFVCHMGFACVTAPVTFDSTSFVLCFGPYDPGHKPEGMVQTAARGVSAFMGESVEELPFEVSDIRAAQAESVAAISEWLRESLERAWHASALNVELGETTGDQTPSEANGPSRRKRYAGPSDPYSAAAIVAAFAAGDRTEARALVDSELFEAEGAKAVRLAVKRGRAIALVGAALEYAERAGLSTVNAWARYDQFHKSARTAATDKDLRRAALDALAPLKPSSRQRPIPDDPLVQDLHKIVADRLEEGVELRDIAAMLNRNPTAITHHLKRKYGLSFGQYVGRLRVDRAKELLRRTKLGVGDVARRVGIADTSNFSKLFRKFEGMAPGEYRKRYVAR